MLANLHVFAVCLTSLINQFNTPLSISGVRQAVKFLACQAHATVTLVLWLSKSFCHVEVAAETIFGLFQDDDFA
jgi:hypothetical protein